MIKEEDIVKIGKFQRTHALKGELNMISDINPEYFMEGNPLIVEIDGIFVPFYAESIRPKGKTSYLVKLSGFETEEDASPLVNKEINILKTDADEWLGDEILSESDWIGFKVFDSETNKYVGEITDIEDSTVNILMIVETDEGNEVFIPFNEELITEVDEENKSLQIKIPDGLIELNQKE